MDPLNTLLNALGAGTVGLGTSGPDFNAMSLPREDIISGIESMLGTQNEAMLNREAPRRAEGLITPRPVYNNDLSSLLMPDQVQPSYNNDLSSLMPPSPRAAPAQDQSSFDGSRMITNIASVRDQSQAIGQPVTYIDSNAQAQIQKTGPATIQMDQAYQKLRDYSDKIAQATTQEERHRLMFDLREGAISHIEGIQAGIKTKVEEQMGLPKFREVFTNAQRIASEQPRFMEDALKLGKQLTDMETKAQQLVANELKANPGVQSFTRMVDSELSLQQKLMLNIEKTSDTRQAKEQALKEDLLTRTSPEQRKRAAIFDPSLAGASDSDIANFLIKGKHNLSDADKLAITAKTEELLPMSLSGNISAMKVLAQEESDLTGTPVNDTLKKVAILSKAVKDPMAIEKAAMAIFGSKESPDYKAFTAAKMTAATSGKKEDKASYNQTAGALVMRYAQAQEQAKWSGDMSTWQIRDPIVLKAIEDTKKPGMAVSLVDAAKTAMSTVPTNQRAQVADLFKQEIFSNAKRGSLLFSTDPDAAWNQVQAEVAKSRFSSFTDAMQKAGNLSDYTASSFLKGGMPDTITPALDYLFGNRK